MAEAQDRLKRERAQHSISVPRGTVDSQEQLDVRSAQWWNKFGKHVGLSCSTGGELPGLPPVTSREGLDAQSAYADETRRRELRDAMRMDGYIEVERWDDVTRLKDETTRFAKAIDALNNVGLPANFLLAFDEVWHTVERLRAVLEPTLGHGLTYDFYIFNIQPGGIGWGMHRERAGVDAKAAFASGGGPYHGLPYYNTVWLALTDATPKTSCMYALPAAADPGMLQQCAAPALDKAILSKAQATAPSCQKPSTVDDEDLPRIIGQAHQHIRALPVSQGTALVWSQRLIHWGSSHGGAPQPRKTLAFALAEPNFEPPLLSNAALVDAAAEAPAADGRVEARQNVRELANGRIEGRHGSPPRLEARLALIAHLLVRYHHEASHPAPLWPRTLLLALNLLGEHASTLSDAAFEWYSTSKLRSSPIGHGTLLQCTLATLYAQHQRTDGDSPIDTLAQQTLEAVTRIARHIVHERGITASEDVQRIARS